MKKSRKTVSTIAPPPFVEEDEINFLDLFRVLWRWKVLVVCAVLVGLVVPVAYSALMPPTYRAVAYLLPPLDKQVEGLNAEGVNENNKPDYTASYVYSAFINRLGSNEFQRRYLKEQKADEGLSSDFSVERVQDEVVVSFQGEDAKQAAQWVNGYVKLANESMASYLMHGEAKKWEETVQRLHDKIVAMRHAAKWHREKRIAKLEEAEHIAARLGIKENAIVTSGKVVVITNPSGLPLYMEGSKALRATVEVLRERKSDDPFIAGMAGIQARLAKLKGFDPVANISHVSAVRIRSAATVPSKPINQSFSRKGLLAGLLGGVIFGMFAAFFADFICRMREKGSAEVEY